MADTAVDTAVTSSSWNQPEPLVLLRVEAPV